MGLFIDHVLTPKDLSVLYIFTLIVLVVGILFGLLRFFSQIIHNRIIINTNYYLANHIRKQFLQVKNTTFHHSNNANLIQVLTHDLPNCQFIFSYVLSIFLEIMSFSIIFFILFNINPYLPLAFGLAVPIYYSAYRFFSKRIASIHEKIIQTSDSVSKVVENIKSNFLTYKRSAPMNAIDQKYDRLLKDTYYWQRKRGYTEGYFSLANQLLLFLISLSVLFYGGYLVVTDSLTIGYLTTLILYSTRFFTPIENVSKYLVACKTAMISIKRVYAYYHLSDKADGGLGLLLSKGQITINRYSFPTGFQLSACIQRGQLNFIIGLNGIGKSTLLHSIVQESPVPKDTIYIDGQDVTLITQKDIFHSIIFLSQKEQFANYTVREQLHFADVRGRSSSLDPFTKQKITAFTNEKLKQFDYDSLLTELSGGQRQYLLILSSLREFPQILFLDETLAHLDEETHQSIYLFLRELANSITIIIITHQLQNIDRDYDRVIVLDKMDRIKQALPSQFPRINEKK